MEVYSQEEIEGVKAMERQDFSNKILLLLDYEMEKLMREMEASL